MPGEIAVSGEKRPVSYVATAIQVRLEDIKQDLRLCVRTFERVFGGGQIPSIKEEKGVPTPANLPFVEIYNSLNQISEDLAYLAKRLDSEL